MLKKSFFPVLVASCGEGGGEGGQGEGSGANVRFAPDFLATCSCSSPISYSQLSKMEEDPTPVPSVGTRKHLITNEEGVITGEETSVDLGHTESGQVAVGHVVQPRS